MQYPNIFDPRALTLQSTFSIVNVPLVLAPCNVLPVVPHQSTPPLMFLVPLLPRDLIRLPLGLRCGTVCICEILDLCWSRQKTAVNQLQGSHNSIVCLTNTVLHMRHCHSVVGPISHITSLAAGRPLDRPREGPSSDFSLYSSFFFARHARIHTSLLQRECGFLYVAPSTSRMPC
jgi:hypothetical protein